MQAPFMLPCVCDLATIVRTLQGLGSSDRVFSSYLSTHGTSAIVPRRVLNGVSVVGQPPRQKRVRLVTTTGSHVDVLRTRE